MAGREGQQLGNYRVTRLLGSGGFAEVYLAEHAYLKTHVALKFLLTPLGQDGLQGFLNEAQIIARLRHPHIIQVTDFQVDGTIPYLVMDYAPNGTLRMRHPKGMPVALSTLLTYATQVAEGLQYAHDCKVIHRDIKPENLLLDKDDRVLLSDFGIAVALQQEKIHLTVAGVAPGTVAYGAPEQFEAGGHLTVASDQYALGTVVYEWITGTLPFQGATRESLIFQKRSSSPLPLRAGNASISPALEQVVLKALSRDPTERYPTVRAFAEALTRAGHSRPTTFLPPLPNDAPTLPVEAAPPLVARNRQATFLDPRGIDAPTLRSAQRDERSGAPAPAADGWLETLASQLSLTHHLGELIPPKYTLRHTTGQIGCALWVLAGGIALLLYQTGAFSATRTPPSTLSDALLACVLGIGLIALALVLIRTAPGAYYDWLYLYDQGLVYLQEKPVRKNLEGKEVVRDQPALAVLRWENVEVRWAIPKRDNMRRIEERALKVKGPDLESLEQREFTYTRGYRDFQGLVKAIEQRLMDVKRLKTIEQYERGEQVTFESIALSTTGIRSQGTWLEWEEVLSVDFSQGYTLVIKARGRNEGVLLGQEELLNVCLLQALFAHIQSRKGYELKLPAPA